MIFLIVMRNDYYDRRLPPHHHDGMTPGWRSGVTPGMTCGMICGMIPGWRPRGETYE